MSLDLKIRESTRRISRQETTLTRTSSGDESGGGIQDRIGQEANRTEDTA
jgi:hypothetical protein